MEEQDLRFNQLVASAERRLPLLNRHAQVRVRAWLVHLKRQHSRNAAWNRCRVQYAALLLEQLRCGVLEPPFHAMPPAGALPPLPLYLTARFLPSAAATAAAPNARNQQPCCIILQPATDEGNGTDSSSPERRHRDGGGFGARAYARSQERQSPRPAQQVVAVLCGPPIPPHSESAAAAAAAANTTTAVTTAGLGVRAVRARPQASAAVLAPRRRLIVSGPPAGAGQFVAAAAALEGELAEARDGAGALEARLRMAEDRLAAREAELAALSAQSAEAAARARDAATAVVRGALARGTAPCVGGYGLLDAGSTVTASAAGLVEVVGALLGQPQQQPQQQSQLGVAPKSDRARRKAARRSSTSESDKDSSDGSDSSSRSDSSSNSGSDTDSSRSTSNDDGDGASGGGNAATIYKPRSGRRHKQPPLPEVVAQSLRRINGALEEEWQLLVAVASAAANGGVFVGCSGKAAAAAASLRPLRALVQRIVDEADAWRAHIKERRCSLRLVVKEHSRSRSRRDEAEDEIEVLRESAAAVKDVRAHASELAASLASARRSMRSASRAGLSGWAVGGAPVLDAVAMFWGRARAAGDRAAAAAHTLAAGAAAAAALEWPLAGDGGLAAALHRHHLGQQYRAPPAAAAAAAVATPPPRRPPPIVVPAATAASAAAAAAAATTPGRLLVDLPIASPRSPDASARPSSASPRPSAAAAPAGGFTAFAGNDPPAAQQRRSRAHSVGEAAARLSERASRVSERAAALLAVPAMSPSADLGSNMAAPAVAAPVPSPRSGSPQPSRLSSSALGAADAHLHQQHVGGGSMAGTPAPRAGAAIGTSIGTLLSGGSVFGGPAAVGGRESAAWRPSNLGPRSEHGPAYSPRSFD